MKNVKEHATQCKMVIADKVVVQTIEFTKKITSIETIGVLSTCQSVVFLARRNCSIFFLFKILFLYNIILILLYRYNISYFIMELPWPCFDMVSYSYHTIHRNMYYPLSRILTVQYLQCICPQLSELEIHIYMYCGLKVP